MQKPPRQITIPQNMPGFSRFIGSWLLTGDINLLVDVGPARTAKTLIAGLENCGLERLDWVLLTHIHIDHAGALADILEKYPSARAVCHARGVRFLVDPAKLWVGSLSVLGDVATAYGEPKPVPEDRIVAHTDMDLPGLSIIETPGHAVHHLSYIRDGCLFSGEAAGNLLSVKGQEYLRPATPTRFFLEEAVKSVDRMLEQPDMPIYYAHVETASGSHLMLNRFRRQLLRWERIIKGVLEELPVDVAEIDALEPCTEALLTHDPELAAFSLMEPGERQRERTFLANSIKGYLGYIRNQ